MFHWPIRIMKTSQDDLFLLLPLCSRRICVKLLFHLHLCLFLPFMVFFISSCKSSFLLVSHYFCLENLPYHFLQYKSGIKNSFNFCLSKKQNSILPSSLKDIFTEYRYLVEFVYLFIFVLFVFSTSNMTFHQPLVCMVSNQKTTLFSPLFLSAL